MSYACGEQPEQLPIVKEQCLITNRGTAGIVLGQSSSHLRAYGTEIPPGGSVLYDLSQPRWIASCEGVQRYDILPGGQSSMPTSSEVATQLLSSGLAESIGDFTSSAILRSALSSQIANDIRSAGTRIIDTPEVIPFGPLDSYDMTFVGAPMINLTDAQSVAISWHWGNNSAANQSVFGELTVAWWGDLYAQSPFGTEQYEIAGPNVNVPGTIGLSERGVVHLPVKAPGMTLAFQGWPSPGGANRILATGYVLKSYRQASVSKWATDQGADRILGFATAPGVAGGGTVTGAFPFSPYDGQLELHAWCSSTAGPNSHVRFGYGSQGMMNPIGGAGLPMEDVLFFPTSALGSWVSRQTIGGSRRPVYVKFYNAEPGAQDFSAWITVGTYQ